MRLSVCLGCCAVFLLKKTDKMVCVFIAHGQGDFMYFLVGGNQQSGGGFHPLSVKVFKRRRAKSGGEFMADSIFAHMIVVRQVIQPERFHKRVIKKAL